MKSDVIIKNYYISSTVKTINSSMRFRKRIWYGLTAVTVVRLQLNVSEINYSSVIHIVLHVCLPQFN